MVVGLAEAGLRPTLPTLAMPAEGNPQLAALPPDDLWKHVAENQ
jgi:hypothetical protein